MCRRPSLRIAEYTNRTKLLMEERPLAYMQSRPLVYGHPHKPPFLILKGKSRVSLAINKLYL